MTIPPTDIVVSGEECEKSVQGRAKCGAGLLLADNSIDPASQAFGFHCDHWYEDEGCCYCKTDSINLIVIDFGDEST